MLGAAVAMFGLAAVLALAGMGLYHALPHVPAQHMILVVEVQGGLVVGAFGCAVMGICTLVAGAVSWLKARRAG